MHKMLLLSLYLNRYITNNFQSALKSTLTESEDTSIALQIDKCFKQRVTHARMMWTHHWSTLGENALTGADVAGLQKCAPVRDKAGCTETCGKLCPTRPTANQLGQNQCSVYSTGTSTVIVKQKQHVTAQLSAQLGHPNKSNFQGQYQGLCINAKD